MAGDGRGRYFFLGDLEITGCCFKKKKNCKDQLEGDG